METRGEVYKWHREKPAELLILFLFVFSATGCSVLTNSMASSDLIQIIIPPESLPCVTDGSLTDGSKISLYPKGQPVTMSALHQVSCRMMISMF